MRHANDRRSGVPTTISRARLGDLSEGDRAVKRTYNTWVNLFGRCENPNNPAYKWYGGRGIKVCERWRDFGSFVSDMGFRPEGLTLNRKDNDGHYEPSNCEWADAYDQQRNKSSNVLLVYLGETKTIQAWSEILDIPATRLAQRKRAGFSDKECIEHSVDPGRSPMEVYARRIEEGRRTNVKGSHCFRSVLSAEQVREARQSDSSAQSLAEAWGVSKHTVLRARNRITYGDVV